MMPKNPSNSITILGWKENFFERFKMSLDTLTTLLQGGISDLTEMLRVLPEFSDLPDIEVNAGPPDLASLGNSLGALGKELCLKRNKYTTRLSLSSSTAGTQRNRTAS